MHEVYDSRASQIEKKKRTREEEKNEKEQEKQELINDVKA